MDMSWFRLCDCQHCLKFCVRHRLCLPDLKSAAVSRNLSNALLVHFFSVLSVYSLEILINIWPLSSCAVSSASEIHHMFAPLSPRNVCTVGCIVFIRVFLLFWKLCDCWILKNAVMHKFSVSKIYWCNVFQRHTIKDKSIKNYSLWYMQLVWELKSPFQEKQKRFFW